MIAISQIVLRYRDLGDRLSMSITDQGPGFDHQALLAGEAGAVLIEEGTQTHDVGDEHQPAPGLGGLVSGRRGQQPAARVRAGDLGGGTGRQGDAHGRPV